MGKVTRLLLAVRVFASLNRNSEINRAHNRIISVFDQDLDRNGGREIYNYTPYNSGERYLEFNLIAITIFKHVLMCSTHTTYDLT